jgi:hypothetical protein
MKKLLAVAAVAAGLFIAQAASAASVDVNLTQSAPGSNSWALTIDNHSSSGVIILNAEITGVSALTLNPANAGIDTTLSLLSVDAFGPGDDFLVISNAAPANIANAGAIGVLLGTLTSNPGAIPVLTAAEVNAGQPTLFNASNQPITDFSLNVIPAPEPVSLVLVGIGIASTALLRRRTV